MNQPPKIKILFRHRSMEMGGVEKVLLSLLNNLNPNKFDLTLYLTLNQGELRNQIPFHVKKVFLAKGKEDMYKNPLLHKIQLIKRKIQLLYFNKFTYLIDKNIIKDSYDIEVAMTYNDFDLVLKSSNKKSKKVGWFHSEIQLPKLQPLVPKILKQFPCFDEMIYCSNKIKEAMHNYYPDLNYPSEKVILNAVPIEEIKSKSEEKIENLSTSPLFFSMARLHTRKGFHKLIDAHARLIEEGFEHTVLILGEGEEEFNLRNQIKNLNVENSFIIRPFELNPYPYLKQANFFILPSESEAWPLVISEALILKKPIIATNVGDVGLMIQDKKTGHLINYDTEEIYEAMKLFLTDAKYVERIKEGLKEIDYQFDNVGIFTAIEETFINLIRNDKS